VLGVKTWSRQAEILRACAGNLRVAVKSGQKTGKSTSAVILALWFAVTRPDARVFMTNASSRQVREVLWLELTKRYRKSKIPIGGDLHETPSGGLRFRDGRHIIGFTVKDEEGLGGFSGPNMLFILDEASGIPPFVFNAIEGNRAGGNVRVVMFSNPTRTSGEFYDAFHAKREFYHTITVSSLETPNVVERRTVISGLAGVEHIEEKRREWGEDSPLYAVRILGRFPAQGDNVVIGLSLIEEAIARYDDVDDEDAPLDIGVDPARFGDDESAITGRRGVKALPTKTFHGLDGNELAAQVVAYAREHKRPVDARKPRIKIDDIGVGASPTDALRKDYAKEVDVIPVSAGAAATCADYALIRDQVWFSLRDWMKEGGAIPRDSKLESELAAPTYELDVRGRYKVEPKDNMKKRLKRSPDRADSLGLAVFEPPFARVVAPKAKSPAYRLGGGAQRGF
jgi:phage terminase large subunit